MDSYIEIHFPHLLVDTMTVRWTHALRSTSCVPPAAPAPTT